MEGTFEMLTGKPIASWLKEFQQRAAELPKGEQEAPIEPAMPLADAYAILGLKPNSPLDDVEKRYRVLANLFHPDKPGGYEEAMKLLNRAYERLQGHRGGSR
ncbi:unnamed protein product [marine sediment metagenome]|uniref:J domain-containing protein n=1 Tax=marine sediment metagenome TaxID=412755 RepID=X1SR58_9ZZZZ